MTTPRASSTPCSVPSGPTTSTTSSPHSRGRHPPQHYTRQTLTLRAQTPKYEDGQKRPIYDLRPQVPGASADIDGYPMYVDAGFANMGVSAKFAAFGDPSVYIIRIVNGVRFERSDDFAFTLDLVTFKAVIRLDAGLADTAGLKVMQNAAS